MTTDSKRETGVFRHAAAELGLEVQPAPVLRVRGEKARLYADGLNTWQSRTMLRALRPLGPDKGIVAIGSLTPGSVTVRHEGRVLTCDLDYAVDELWGALALAENSTLENGVEVEVDYAYSKRRLDAWVELSDGSRVVRQGEPDLTTPHPVALDPGERHIANVYLDYRQSGEQADVFWVLTDEERDPTLTRPGRLPQTLDRLKTGRPVKMVCWGDSVTEGGDASSSELAFPRHFERLLRARYPDADFELQVVAVDGSGTGSWIEPSGYEHPTRQAECDWQRVVDAKPDVVSLEFVNDDYLSFDPFRPRYEEILRRVRDIEAELILITPHFTAPGWQTFRDLRGADPRPYVRHLLAFAAEHNLAVADASSRWAGLWKRGLPYPTLLRNGLNHPDDRGHAIYAEELLACFA